MGLADRVRTTGRVLWGEAAIARAAEEESPPGMMC